MRDAKELRRLLNDGPWLVERLGLLEGSKREGRDCIKILCPWHADRRPSCSVKLRADGTLSVWCFCCQHSGTALDLIAAAHGLDCDRKEDFVRVKEEAERLLGGTGDTPPPRRPAPAVKKRPPAEEVAKAWAGSFAASEEPDLLQVRGLDAAEVEAAELARLLPRTARLPRWARCQGQGWAARHRVLVPLYGAGGDMESLHARDLQPGAADPKALSPTGCLLAGLVMANARGQELLRTGAAPAAGVLVAEGVPDFLTLALLEPERAVLGLVGWSWSDDIAGRVPDGAAVTIWTHTDAEQVGPDGRPRGEAGQKYAQKLVRSLRGRCPVRWVHMDVPKGAKKAPDANDLLRAGGAAAVRAELGAARPWAENAAGPFDDALLDDGPPDDDVPPPTEEDAPPAGRGSRKKRKGNRPPPSPDLPVFKIGSDSEIATELLRHLQQEQQLVFDRGGFWTYGTEAGIWAPLSDDAVLTAVRRFDGALVLDGDEEGLVRMSLSKAKGAIRMAGAELRLQTDRFFDRAPRGVACADCFLALVDGRIERRPHAPDHRQTFSLAVPYDEDAPADRFVRFLNEVLRLEPGEDEVARERASDAYCKQLFLQEFVGACLFGIATDYEIVLFLPGTGGNGKSQFIKMVTALFPPAAVSRVTPQRFSDLRHRAMLAGARLNAVTEVPEHDLMDTEGLKALASGDEVMAEPKYKDPFWFRPIAGNLFACNKLPATTDATMGFWDKVAVVEFLGRFRDSPDRVLNLADQIIAAELPGILAWAVAGAERLLKKGRYTAVKSSQVAKAVWKRESSSVESFAAEQLEKGDRAEVKARSSDLYSRYVAWTRANGLRAVSSIKFSKELHHGLGFDRWEEGKGTFFAAYLRSSAQDEVDEDRDRGYGRVLPFDR